MSLHKKFLRIKNEGNGGKSSWWTVNPSERDNKTTRRKTSYRKKKNSHSNKCEILRKLSKLTANKDSASASSNSSKYESINVHWDNSRLYLDAPERKWRSHSSNSSEDTSSFPSTSPLSLDRDNVNQDTYFSSNSIYTPPVSHSNINVYLKQSFSPNINPDILQFTAATFGDPNQISQSNLESFYSLGNKFYTYYSSESSSPSNEEHQSNIPSPDFTEEINTSISREYFKSPHHLSGSYITSEIGNLNAFRNHTNNKGKRCLSTFIDSTKGLDTTQRSSTGTESYELNKKTSSLISSCLSQDLVPPIHHYLNTEESQNTAGLKILNGISDRSTLINYSNQFAHFSNTESEELKYRKEPEYAELNFYDIVTELKSDFDLHINDTAKTFNFTEKDIGVTVSSTADNMRKKALVKKIDKYGECTMSKFNDQSGTYDRNENGHQNRLLVSNSTENMQLRGSEIENSYGQNLTLQSTSRDSGNIAIQTHEINNCLMRYVPNLTEIFSGLYIPVGITINYEAENKREIVKEVQTPPDVLISNDISDENLKLNERSVLRAYITPLNEYGNSDLNLHEPPNETTMKIHSLLLQIVNVILVRLRVMSDSLTLVEDLSKRINEYNSDKNIKQILAFLTELYILINATYVKFLKDTFVEENPNCSSHFFINTRNYNQQEMKELTDIFFKLLTVQVTSVSSERLLDDEKLESMSFPPDINTYLWLYFKDIHCDMGKETEINSTTSLAAQIYHRYYQGTEFLPGPFIKINDSHPEIMTFITYTNEETESSVQNIESYPLISHEYNSNASYFLQTAQLQQPDRHESTSSVSVTYYNELINNGNSIQYIYAYNPAPITIDDSPDDFENIDINDLVTDELLLEDFIRTDGDYTDITNEDLQKYP